MMHFTTNSDMFMEMTVEQLESMITPAAITHYNTDRMYSPLHVAAMYNRVDLLQYLINVGMISHRDRDNETPLGIAKRFDGKEAFEYLTLIERITT